MKQQELNLKLVNAVGSMVREFREKTGLMRAGGLAPNMERYLEVDAIVSIASNGRAVTP